ncbi:HAD family hydrolase [Lapidilactobacillus bayanensis]|uniref:HAD family hydrolase n=1 Tax=Lapidilactobacillus bayanensis TaxID=2485998 RepID=UPI000F780F30|nr:HAD family hydrolase [Lapidilactobacillus bayanensis]
MKLTFDCYGTLLNMQPIDEVIARLARDQQLDSQIAVATYNSYEDRLMYQAKLTPYDKLIAENLSYLDLELTADHWFVNHLDDVLTAYQQLQPHPDVLPAFMQLKAQGHQLYLMSNSAPEFMRNHLAALDDLPDGVLLPNETGCYKPDLPFFEMATKKWQLTNENHIHIAKGYWWDIVPATQLNWRKIWINRDHKNGRQREQPYSEFTDLTPVVELLAKQQ